MNRLENGDLIIDEPNEKGVVNYYFMPKQWPDLKGEVTIWLDGNKLGFLNQIRFQNTVDELPWNVDKVIFKNVPGTVVKTQNFTVKGVKHCIIEGSGLGITDWPDDRKYMSGHFGFHTFQYSSAGHGFDISVQPGGSIIMSGFECQYGFDNLRLQQKNQAADVDLTLENFYLHDTYDGEGIYAGSTQKEPIPRFRKVKISNGVIARAATEALQLQNIADSDISNLTIYAADTSWLSAFQQWQDAGIQFKANGGLNRLRNSIIDGFGATGFNAFSVQNYISQGINGVSVEDCLFYDGRGIGAYFNSDCVNGIKWIFKNVVFGGFNNTYYNSLNPDKNYIFGMSANAKDTVTLNGVIYDNTKSEVMDNPSRYIVDKVINHPVPAPVYKNSGFTEKASQIMQWRPYYAPYFGVPPQTPIEYQKGQIVIDTQAGYSFYKCNIDHIVGSFGPSILSTVWTKLTWDRNGVRSDQDNFTGSYSGLPPDDFRLVGSDYKNMGIFTKERILEEYYLNGKRVTITNLNRYE